VARWLILGYGAIAYLLFGATFAYMVGFLGNWVVPKTIDSGATGPLWLAYTIDAGWFVLFAIQHSGMARPRAKERLTRIIPAAAERSTYVLITTLLVILLIWQWRPLPQVVWSVEAPAARLAMQAVSSSITSSCSA
jgi:protein-S-isoprenylcysteine O-methyltransferase Ste14